MITETGGEMAWRAGFCRIPLMVGSFVRYDEWYHESYQDGLKHFYDMKAAEFYQASQVKRTKEIRAKFKAIRAKK